MSAGVLRHGLTETRPAKRQLEEHGNGRVLAVRARITKYSEPVPFHKTMGTHKLVIMKRIDDDDAAGSAVFRQYQQRNYVNDGLRENNPRS